MMEQYLTMDNIHNVRIRHRKFGLCPKYNQTKHIL
jgi:hypothetical protein